MNAINIEKLSDMVRQKRNNRNLRETATEIGEISISTLSRIEQGRVPDINTFFRLCKWLELSPNDFNNTKEQNEPHKERVFYHLRADKTLPEEVNNALIKMVELAYQNSKTLGNHTT